MDNEEMLEALSASPPPEKAMAILNQAYNKKYLKAFIPASQNPQYINNPEILKLMVKTVAEKPQESASLNIVDNIFYYLETEMEPGTLAQLNAAALSNPRMASMILLNANAPKLLVDNLISVLKLYDTKITGMQNPVLQAIIKDLREGESWNNLGSGYLLGLRLSRFNQDQFVTEISKYNLAPEIAKIIMSISGQLKGQNPALYNNFKNNTNPGPEIAKLIYTEDFFNLEPIAIIPGIMDSLGTAKYNTYSNWIWEIIKKKMTAKPEWELQVFKSNYAGNNILDVLLNISLDIIPELIDILKTSPNINIIKQTPVYGRIVHEALQNPSYRDKILELPEEYFRMLSMNQSDAQIISDHFYPKKETIKYYKGFEDLMAASDWYIKYAISQELLKEAGWKENIATGLVAAILMIMSGSTVEAASKKTKVNPVIITKVLQDKNMMDKIKKQYKQPEKEIADLSMDDIFGFIANNECYKDKQGNPILNQKAYLDPSKKNMAIGVGFNLDRPMAKKLIKGMGLNYNAVRSGKQLLTKEQIKRLFEYDADLAQDVAKKFINNYNQLPKEIKLILVDIAYNMGEGGINQFKKFKDAIEKNDFERASNELKNSKWFAQVKGRGQRSTDMLLQLATYPSMIAETVPEVPPA